MRHEAPEIFTTGQGSQFASTEFHNVLAARETKISMDSKGAWRTIKYEEVFLLGDSLCRDEFPIPVPHPYEDILHPSRSQPGGYALVGVGGRIRPDVNFPRIAYDFCGQTHFTGNLTDARSRIASYYRRRI